MNQTGSPCEGLLRLPRSHTQEAGPASRGVKRPCCLVVTGDPRPADDHRLLHCSSVLGAEEGSRPQAPEAFPGGLPAALPKALGDKDGPRSSVLSSFIFTCSSGCGLALSCLVASVSSTER